MRCATFGVVVFKASMLNWGFNLPWVYMHCAIYIKLIWCNGFPEIYARLAEGEWGQSAMGISALCYIYIYIYIYNIYIYIYIYI